MKKRGVIFDLNGSLDNTDQSIIKAFQSTLEKHLPGRDTDLRRFAEELMVFFWQADKLADLKYPQWNMADIIERAVSRWSHFRRVNMDVQQFAKDYGLIRKECLTIRPEFVVLIKEMPRSVLKFIFSQGNSKRDVLVLLDKVSLAESDFTEILVTGSFHEENKPSINILKSIMDKYSLDPAGCLLVGDDVFLDIMPAKILGMKTILISEYVDVLAAGASEACAQAAALLGR